MTAEGELPAEALTRAAVKQNAEHVVDAVVGGHRVVLGFVLNRSEHQRRIAAGVGAVTSRRLLHALWDLPHHLPWPTDAIDPVDTATLLHDGHGLVTFGEDLLTRTYAPAGRIRAVATVRRRLGDAVAAVTPFPPVFRRYAVSTSMTLSDETAARAAVVAGIGVIAGSGTSTMFVESAEPLVGAPGVYRWWLAEVCYRAWLPNAH